MLEINDQNFKAEVLQNGVPVLVDFYAEWCSPCQMAEPVIEELAKEYEGKIKVGKLNVSKNLKMATEYGIMSIPTVIIFKEGKEVKREVGFPGKSGYKELIDRVLGDSK